MGSDGGEAWYQLQRESHNQQRRAACKAAFSSDLLRSGLVSPQSFLPGDILTDPKVCLLDSSKPNQVDNPEWPSLTAIFTHCFPGQADKD